ncbi:MAG: hypothetical protein SGPRY_000528, partial [Prymnesium sp.]
MRPLALCRSLCRQPLLAKRHVPLRQCSTATPPSHPNKSDPASKPPSEPRSQPDTSAEASVQASAAGPADTSTHDPSSGAARGETAAATNAAGFSPGGSDGRSGLVLQEQEEDNLPPLAFEPGVAGAAQKGVSASPSLCIREATQTIFNEALEEVKANGDISYMLGSPLRAFGADHGGGRGRRNAIERWDLSEGESEVIVARFHVSGPQGFGTVQVQAPANRRRGQFNYIIFEHPQTRKMIH